MKFLPKNLCKKLSVANGIGVCNLKNCLCQCWNCEDNRKCGKNAFEKCSLKSEDFKVIPNAFMLYDDAIKSAERQISSTIEMADPKRLLGGLLYRREEEIVHCFYEAPGDLPSAISTANACISKDLSAITHEDIEYTEEAHTVWNLVIAKEVFSNQRARLKNGDVVCYGNKRGEEELRLLVSNPIHNIEQLDDFIKKKTPPPLEGQNVRLVYSTKMLPVMEWCRSNVNHANMLDYTLYENFGKILKHLEDVGNSGEISPSVCYKLSYPHYAGMIHVCRYVYSRFSHIKNISNLNKGIDQAIKTKYSITLDVGKNYDAFLFDLWHIDKNEKMCINDTIGRDTEEYRFNIKDGSLFGSVLLLSFISKNYESICLKPYERGRVFEDLVEKELLDRQVALLKRNFETPEGEVDFVCSKKGKVFFIEAKDYSPWFDDSYISSKTYSERVNSINKKLQNTPPRLRWIESNQKALGISVVGKVKGIILTRFYEPHITIPPGFQHIPIDELDELFGESIYHKIYETSIKFRIGENELPMLKNEVSRVTDLSRYGLR